MTDAAAVDASNADQARAWDGGEGAYWAANAERFEKSMTRYSTRFLGAAEIGASARVVDIGCGTGATTRDAARLASRGSALGVDLSSQMIEVARQRAAASGIANAHFEQADAQIHPFAEHSADVVISRTGAMFFGDPVTAFRNLARALRPDGRLVLLVWQAPHRTEWITAITTALAAGRNVPSPPPQAPGPFSMSDPDRVRSLLTAAGFADPQFESLEEPMYFGARVDDAYPFIAGLTAWMLEGLDDNGKARARDDLRTTIGKHETRNGVLFASAAWLITTAPSDRSAGTVPPD